MAQIKIDVIVDTVCPWCYVGKKRLEKGIAAYHAAYPDRSDAFSIAYHPFYLNPYARAGTVDRAEELKKKYGPQAAEAMWKKLAAIGEEVGIPFKFGGPTGKTRDSHRLIQFAGTKGAEVQDKVVSEVFRSYFEQEGDITSHEMLTAAAVRAGLDEGEVGKVLETDAQGRVVDEEVEEAQDRNIGGVPYFRINDGFEISGAQEPEVFVHLFERLVKTGTL